jgi:hypothetical protein
MRTFLLELFDPRIDFFGYKDLIIVAIEENALSMLSDVFAEVSIN